MCANRRRNPPLFSRILSTCCPSNHAAKGDPEPKRTRQAPYTCTTAHSQLQTGPGDTEASETAGLRVKWRGGVTNRLAAHAVVLCTTQMRRVQPRVINPLWPSRYTTVRSCCKTVPPAGAIARQDGRQQETKRTARGVRISGAVKQCRTSGQPNEIRPVTASGWRLADGGWPVTADNRPVYGSPHSPAAKGRKRLGRGCGGWETVGAAARVMSIRLGG